MGECRGAWRQAAIRRHARRDQGTNRDGKLARAKFAEGLKADRAEPDTQGILEGQIPDPSWRERLLLTDDARRIEGDRSLF